MEYSFKPCESPYGTPVAYNIIYCSVGKESACNAGDLGSIPASGRSHREGIGYSLLYSWNSLVAQTVKNPPVSTGDLGSMPGLGRCPGGGNGNTLKYPCLENPMKRGALQTTVHEVAKSQIQLSD